ncbi:MAG: hypothetical protein WKF43_13085 [Acidimicrobiales bacterium]
MGTDVDLAAHPMRSPHRAPHGRWWAPALLVMPVLLLMTSTSSAQVQAQADEVEEVLRVNRVDVSAFPDVELIIHPRNRSLLGLEVDQVTLTELGRRRPVALEALPGSALNVGVVIDVSTGGEALREVKGAAIELLLSLPDGARSLLLTGDGRPVAGTEATSDLTANLEALRSLDAGTGAPVAEAIVPALDRLRPAGASRTTVVLVSAEPVSGFDETMVRTASSALARDRRPLHPGSRGRR